MPPGGVHPITHLGRSGAVPSVRFPPLVRTSEQVAGGLAPEKGSPSTTLVLRPVMVHVAPLTEGSEVLVRVVAGVVVAMRGSEHHPGRAQAPKLLEARQALESVPPSVTPAAGRGIPPASIAQMVDRLPVRPSATLTGASCPSEADHGGELWPVDRVVEAVLAPDWHRDQVSLATTAAWLRARA